MTHWCCVQARSFSRYYVKAKLLLPKNNIDWKSPIDNRELINKSECFPQAIIASIVMSFFSIPTFEFAFFCHSNGGSCWVKEQSRKQKKKTTAMKWVWYINRTDWIPLHDNFGGNVVLKRTKRFVCAVPRKLICQIFLPAHTRHTTQTKIFSNNDYAERKKNHHALLRLVRR